MANSKIPNVDLTDTFNTSRVRFNNLLDSVGDVSTLTTAATDVTSAINEHDAELGTITSGVMGTTAGTVSGAIAELDDRLDSINNTQIQSAKLLMNDSSAVSAIKGKLDVHGDLYAGGILYTDQIKSATASEQVFINDTLELQANDINDVNNIHLRTALIHDGDTNTKLEFGTDTIDLHTGGTARVAITNNDVTISENLTVQDSAYVTGNLAVGGNATIGGTLIVDGEVTFKAGANSNINFGDGDGDNVVFNADVNSSIIPNTDNTYDLGSSTKEWRHGYFDGTVNADNVAADSATMGTVKVTDLTNNRVVIAGGSGELEDDGNLTFDGTTFEVGTKFDVDVATGNTNIDGNLDVDGTTDLDTTNVDGDLDVSGSFTTITTDGLTEGNNLYYTTARADSDAKNSVSANDAGGDGSFTYNNATGVFTYTGPSATEVRAHISAGEGIDFSAGGVISGEDATTSNKGIASFSSSNFAVNSGVVTVKNNGIILGTETTGNYVATIAGTANEITVSGSGSETASVTVSLPDDVIIGNNLTVTNDFTVGGSFTVQGEQRISAQYIFLQDGTTGTPILNAGITVDRGNQDSAIFQWNETNDYWEAGTKTDKKQLARQFADTEFTNLTVGRMVLDSNGIDTVDGGSIWIKADSGADGGANILLQAFGSDPFDGTITIQSGEMTKIKSFGEVFLDANKVTIGQNALNYDRGLLILADQQGGQITTNTAPDSSGYNVRPSIDFYDRGAQSYNDGDNFIKYTADSHVFYLGGIHVRDEKQSGTRFDNQVSIGGVVTLDDNLMHGGQTLTLNADFTGTPSTALRSGLEIERGDASNAKFQFNENTDEWEFTGPKTGTLAVTGDIGNATITLTAGTDLSTGGNFTTNQSGNETITINHANITRVDTTSTDSPGYGGTFEAVTGVTTNARGHVTAIDVSTVTIPASDNTDTVYTHPNHTGDVTSSGDGATTIAANAVDAGKLNVSGNGTATQFLRSDADGSFTWATPVDTNTWNANTKTIAGYVSAPGAIANKVWKTDANGNPAWRDDSDTITPNFSAGGGDTIIQSDTNEFIFQGTVASTSNSAAEIQLQNRDTTPQDGNTAGVIKFMAEDDGGTMRSYASISGHSEDVSTIGIDGGFRINVADVTGEAGPGSGFEVLNVDVTNGGIGTTLRSPSSTMYFQCGAFGPIFEFSSENVNDTSSSSEPVQMRLINYDNNPELGDIGKEIATIEFIANNSLDDDITYAYIRSEMTDATSGTEDGRIKFYTRSAGTETLNSTFQGDDLTVQGNINSVSDIRTKENVATVENSLDLVSQLRGVWYNKIGKEDRKVGVIAQEVEEVLPEVVHTDTEGMKSVDYSKMVGVLIEAIKELKQEIDELKGN